MKVVILCGGLGARLREETEFKPKPMVDVGHRPILWHIMKTYAHYGFNDFILCLGYKGQMIKEYFYNYEALNNDFTIELGKSRINVHSNHDESNWKVTLADTGDVALKGARLKRIEKYIDGDVFMVTYGDGVADIDIKALLDFHKSHGKLATLTGVSPSSQFGNLKVKSDRVEAFSEKSQKTSDFVNGGFFVFDRRIFDYLTTDDNCDLEFGVLEKLSKDGLLMMYRHEGFWFCMDTLRDRDYLNRLWSEGDARWKIW